MLIHLLVRTLLRLKTARVLRVLAHIGESGERLLRPLLPLLHLLYIRAVIEPVLRRSNVARMMWVLPGP